ncbi:hypothetical protein U3A58_00270 [Algoriphagus sp. C2-6-M1]|uniref:hypothetical protein n=1 Tax=Algoriphagus persicinus TaxID=3108754 RepID=UPI002B3D9587|nr:hypothetical protein [Algoriphagus sp. C2-6-M1]MEB2778811.1 hypothetical protein [Algoriphagus sp. C2-6-M1]
MIIKTDFSFRKLAIFCIALFGVCFWAGDSMAQGEHEKSEMEHEKPLEKPLVENQSDQIDIQTRDSVTPAAVGNVTNIKSTVPKKETQLSGEGKKAEFTPSTLSFNIFLYIVDKFKAD